MKAPRILLFAAVLLMIFHPLALAQPPVPATAPPAATPAPIATVPPVATQAPPAVAPMATPPQAAPPTFATTPRPARAARPVATPQAPRKTVRPEIAMEPPAPPAISFDQTPPPPPEPPQAPKVVRPTPVAEAATVAPKVVREAPRKPIAVKVEFTITDQLGSKPATKKMMTMTIGTGEYSRIRTSVSYAKKELNTSNTYRFDSAPLSVDARPDVEGNKIFLDFTLEYKLNDDPFAEGVPGGSTTVSERLYAVLDSGVPVVIAQSSDALSDRKVTIEVKATVVK